MDAMERWATHDTHLEREGVQLSVVNLRLDLANDAEPVAVCEDHTEHQVAVPAYEVLGGQAELVLDAAYGQAGGRFVLGEPARHLRTCSSVGVSPGARKRKSF